MVLVDALTEALALLRLPFAHCHAGASGQGVLRHGNCFSVLDLLKLFVGYFLVVDKSGVVSWDEAR